MFSLEFVLKGGDGTDGKGAEVLDSRFSKVLERVGCQR